MYQPRFRINHSTGPSLTQLTDFVLSDIDKTMENDMILVDLQNAFYTSYQEVFLEKLKYLICEHLD